jgi:hypothetical protein
MPRTLEVAQLLAAAVCGIAWVAFAYAHVTGKPGLRVDG